MRPITIVQQYTWKPSISYSVHILMKPIPLVQCTHTNEAYTISTVYTY